ncbi:MAG: sugar phosphate nucleotidyltransferase [Clostridia bacterium]|nr:sugar phosphate nucleotidyltransferase [Clostridia bacterium]
MKTSLVILAAGIGSRFGGSIKQIAPVGPHGEIIIDYSVRDALEAGFNKIVFIIRKDIEKDFKEVIGNRVETMCEVEYVYQSTDILPEGSPIFTDRKKPWGTTHALWCAKNAVNEPFLVINADDYYGKAAYKIAHDFLLSNFNDSEKLSFGMVGFILKNTLSDNGGVTRGVCKTDSTGMLTQVVETRNIMRRGKGVIGEINNESCELDPESLVSMNMWCFTPEVFDSAEKAFKAFIASVSQDDIKSEHVLPTLVSDLLMSNEAKVKVMRSEDNWVGVTYAEDKPYVIEHFKKLILDGVYPEKLF